MGRYSSVQAYADNQSNVRSISYDQATGGKGGAGGTGGGKDGIVAANGKVTAEKVVNPYGSTAGAGSGEFHVYRHARARELARWKELDAQEEEAKAEETFATQLEAEQAKEQEKTAKRRRKRQREKEAKRRKKTLQASGILDRLAQDDDDEEEGPRPKTVKADKDDAENDNEFTYIPLAQQEKMERQKEGNRDSHKKPSGDVSKDTVAPLVEDIPNDGSFLELMKKKLAENDEQQSKEGAVTAVPDTSNTHSVSNSTPATRIVDEDDDEEGPLLPPGF